MVVTMVLHPIGGNLEHLLHIRPIIIGSHGIALLSIPLMAFGFGGLKQSLSSTQGFLANVGFSFVHFSLFSGFVAGMFNGLVLPWFISHYQNETSSQSLNMVQIILRYNASMNHAFSLGFIVLIALAVFLFSVALLQTNIFPTWTAYWGLIASAGALIGLMVIGVQGFVHLKGFSLFVFGLVSWTISIGFFLQRQSTTPEKS
mgnify:CR=1 FL=1